ncbi:MAG TPA: ammonium transporter [Chthoniobacteraceae bacterium]|nr:ammonium transporter [Chthoniobacteraceae bacterium]
MKAVLLATLMAVAAMTAGTLHAQTAAASASAAAPTTEQRLERLEAYVANTPSPGEALPGPGHNGWMMTAAALVLFMTLPGLALSYGGLVRRKNVLSILAQCWGIAGMVTILWWLVGYSLVFAPGKPWMGDLRYALLHHVTSAPNPAYAPWVSQNVFAMFELMFAIITPAIIVGATAERMRFAAVMTFTAIWMFLVYIPITHMVWGVDGALNGLNNPHALIKSIDFAGGMVVHMASGWSSLVVCMMVGKRKGYGKEKMPPHSMVLCMVGTAMLWVGWYGFNSGSAMGADSIAANAFVTTTLSAAAGTLVWAFAEWVQTRKSSVLGFCSGAFGGLVVIAPACGYVTPTGAVIIGLVGGILTYLAVVKLKVILGYDDALDGFGLHAIGGTVGVLLAGILASPEVNPKLNVLAGKTLWLQQLEAIFVVAAVAVIGSLIAGVFVRLFIGMRPGTEGESIGLDLTEHGEEGYIL